MFAKLFQNSSRNPLPKVTRIKTRSVVLRNKRPADLDADFGWRMDAELTKLDASLPINLTKREYRAILEPELRRAPHSSLKLAIETLRGEHIGNCMLYDIDMGGKVAEFGIMIGDKHHWGKGYGSEAAKAMVNYAFTETELEKLYLHTLHSNSRAQKCFAKAGFNPLGELRRNGHLFLKMGVDKQGWQSANGS